MTTNMYMCRCIISRSIIHNLHFVFPQAQNSNVKIYSCSVQNHTNLILSCFSGLAYKDWHNDEDAGIDMAYMYITQWMLSIWRPVTNHLCSVLASWKNSVISSK